MLRTRNSEDEGQRLFTDGVVRGTPHLCQGQEAVSVGVCGALSRGDTMTCTYRGHGAVLAMDAPHLPISVGLAFAARFLDSDSVSVCFFGDGATNIGAFHEALNLASLWKVPAIFVCENNLYGGYSPQHLTTPTKRRADRAAAYAMPGVVVDGNDVNDVFDVHAAARDAIARARSGLLDRP